VSVWWQLALGVVAGLVLLWLLLVALLLLEQRRHPGSASLRELLRLAPDVVRLLTRLARDRSVPVGARIWLGALVAYLLSPIDLIPDFIPVLGYADDALVVAFAVRFAIRRAGGETVRRLWPGTAQGLATVLRLAGLGDPGDGVSRSGR
jgi:uncharacterized membrane protein YkvA (DUF1232 family)